MEHSELDRLKSGPAQGQQSDVGTFFFIVRCASDAEAVLRRIKDVVSVVVQNSTEPWPSDEMWRRLLPAWYVSRCAPEESREKAEAWLRHFKSLPHEQQVKANEAREWSLGNWIYWFQPDNREWFWWNGRVEDSNTLRVTVESAELPFPYDALVWLFRASGATQVEPEM